LGQPNCGAGFLLRASQLLQILYHALPECCSALPCEIVPIVHFPSLTGQVSQALPALTVAIAANDVCAGTKQQRNGNTADSGIVANL
jgi:hypothetical protein